MIIACVVVLSCVLQSVSALSNVISRTVSTLHASALGFAADCGLRLYSAPAGCGVVTTGQCGAFQLPSAWRGYIIFEKKKNLLCSRNSKCCAKTNEANAYDFGVKKSLFWWSVCFSKKSCLPLLAPEQLAPEGSLPARKKTLCVS